MNHSTIVRTPVAVMPVAREAPSSTALAAAYEVAAANFRLGSELATVKDEKQYRAEGHATFAAWLAAHPELDLRERTAYDLMRIADGAEELAIEYEQLAQTPLSILRKIFRLRLDKYGDRIRALLESRGATLADYQDLIGTETPDDKPTLVFRRFALTPDAADVVDQALAEAKNVAGTSVSSQSGETVEATPSRALELICGDFLAGKGDQQ